VHHYRLKDILQEQQRAFNAATVGLTAPVPKAALARLYGQIAECGVTASSAMSLTGKMKMADAA
jgi:hypothetical protein